MANPQEMLERIRENPQIAIGAGVGLLLLIVVGVFVAMNMGGGGSAEKGPCAEKLDKDQMILAKMKSAGKAIEIQALLARERVVLDRLEEEGVGSVLKFREGASICDRDRALVSMVQSGLMDKNVGLEAFDQGDLTASREEKRIKLIRAQQGELARLIRKIDPVEDASVSLSIPEATIFRKDQQPMSASVQVTIPSGGRLTQDKVRAIINLMVGSIQGLDSKHVALSDTNGNTYNSILDSSAELESKIEERDAYMKQKVANQLDKLVGSGNYVVTVSTLLREAPREVLIERYDTNDSAIHSRQRFSENLNAQNGTMGTAGGPTSSMVPNELKSMMGESQSSSNRGYNRVGEEIQYANTKEQTLQTDMPGMIEDISIAVTIDNSHYPKAVDQSGNRVDLDEDDLKRLIAHSASPKVNLDSVSLARISFGQNSGTPIATGSDEPKLPEENHWILWAIGSVGVVMIIVAMLMYLGKDNNPQIETAQNEIHRLQELTNNQQQQLYATQQQTQMIMEAQQRQLEAQQSLPQIQAPPAVSAADLQSLKETLSDLKETVNADEMEPDELDSQIKTWIESV